MNYATNFAIVKNGTVTNLLRGLVYNTMDDFPNAVHTENLDVQIVDTYENGVFMRDGQVVTGGNVGVQSDWNQNDETQPDYVKNRPFYTGDPVETVLVEESTVSFTDNGGAYMAEFPSTFAATVGETYKVYWDGAVYECTCASFSDMPTIGNLSIEGIGSDTGEPFVMHVEADAILIFTSDTSASHTFSISGIASEIVKIPAKFIDKDASGYIAIHRNATMTQQEAQNYNSAVLKGELAFIIWNGIYLKDIYADNESLTIKTQNGEKCLIAKNSEGLFNSDDREISSASFPNNTVTGDVHTAIDVVQKKKILIYSNTTSSGVGSTDVLLQVRPNGSRSKSFDVLGNGEAVAPALILYSSTADSTKKFKITVDDSGTISATEVS